MARRFARGDLVVYRKQKHSTHPGPRAQAIRPASHGEDYWYLVEKYWTVSEVLPSGQLVVKTRRGKEHVLDPQDPSLRKAGWWDRLRHARRESRARR